MSWERSELEATLEHTEIVDTQPLPGPGANQALLITLRDGVKAVFKPQAGERTVRVTIPIGTLWRREVAAYRIDRLLGFGLVPPTVMRDITGPGSLQLFVDASDSLPPENYNVADQQMMGALDYFLANSDRHRQNWLTSKEKRPIAIDHGLTFPSAPDAALNSPWISLIANKDFEEASAQPIRAIDPNICADALRELGIDDGAIGGFINRLSEARTVRITLRAWLS